MLKSADKMGSKHFKKNILIIILLFFLIKLLTISSNVWWDSAVYIGMGKYIYSLGNVGLWEHTRPIVWPLILGFLWKTGFNTVIAGRVIEIVFGSLCILLTYLIGKRLFDEKTALLASIFFALSPTFFLFNGIMLTEIVSTFFSLLAIYLFIEKKCFISGIFLGIAFMTRYLQLFVLVALFLTFDKKNIRNITKLIIGFIITIIPFLLLNQILYNNLFFPFLQQILLSGNSGWLNYHSIGYYFIELFKENFIYPLSLLGSILIFRNRKKMSIVLAFFLFFLFFNLIRQKEMRFLIILFPYMYLLISYPILHFWRKNRVFKGTIFLLIVLSFIFSIKNISAFYKSEASKDYNVLQDKFGEDSVKGKLWISNPIIAVSSNKKIDKLMYYPVFNEEKKKELIKENADFIFLDSCDLACMPTDINCKNNKNELLRYLKQRLKIIYSSKNNQCEQLIFKGSTTY